MSRTDSVVTTDTDAVRTAQDRIMDESSIEDLPRAYRIGLRLRDLGADDLLIAECLEIDPASVGTLLAIGRRKLEHVDGPTPPRADDV
jgi:hypothetical protein